MDMKIRVHRAPGSLITGINAVTQIGAEAKKLHGHKVLIITDPGVAESGSVEKVERPLIDAGLEVGVYAKAVPEPPMSSVAEAVAFAEKGGYDCIIGFGGGSAIDVAKIIAVLVNSGHSVEDYVGIDQVPKRGLPLIAVPTTAGTGSEVTAIAIFANEKLNVKQGVVSGYLIPNVALVDPMMTVKMPRGITAATGLDALTHAIEAYVSTQAQPLTDTFALRAIGLISANLRTAYSYPDDIVARGNMLMGSLQAGLAFANSSVALVHGMSRPIGAYFHVAHGTSNAVLLPTVIEFSVSGNLRRYAEVAEAMGEQTKGLTVDAAAKKTVEAAKRLNADLQIPTLRGLKIDEAKFEIALWFTPKELHTYKTVHEVHVF